MQIDDFIGRSVDATVREDEARLAKIFGEIKALTEGFRAPGVDTPRTTSVIK